MMPRQTVAVYFCDHCGLAMGSPNGCRCKPISGIGAAVIGTAPAQDVGRQTVRPLSDLAAELGRLKRKGAKIRDDISGDDAADLMAKIHAVIIGEKIATLEWAMGARAEPYAIGAKGAPEGHTPDGGAVARNVAR